jgi:hypothetical protein
MNVPVDNEGRCRSRHPRQRSHKRTRCDRAGGPKPGTGQWMSSETITPVYSDPRPPSAHKGSLTPPLNRRKGRGSAILTPHALVGRAARSGYALAAVALVIQLRASFGDDIDWVKAPQPNSRLLQYGASPAGGASHGASVPFPLVRRGSSVILGERREAIPSLAKRTAPGLVQRGVCKLLGAQNFIWVAEG